MLYHKEKLKNCHRSARLLLYANVYFLPNTKLSVNILLTCIFYCDGPGCDLNCLQAVGRFFISRMSYYYIICPRTFFFGDNVALLRESYTIL